VFELDFLISTGYGSNTTCLAKAVASSEWEIIAVLLFHGADPFRLFLKEPGNVSCAFNAIDIHYHGRHRDRFHLMAALLNKRLSEHEYPSPVLDHKQYGRDVDAGVMRVLDSHRDRPGLGEDWMTPLMLVSSLEYGEYFPFCARWLVERKAADVHKENDKGHDAMYFALKSFGMLRPEDKVLHWPAWAQLVQILVGHGANYERWCVWPDTRNAADDVALVLNNMPGAVKRRRL